ncbi:MAG: ABC transporter substrate-binding protein [Actinomycetes bacterium]
MHRPSRHRAAGLLLVAVLLAGCSRAPATDPTPSPTATEAAPVESPTPADRTGGSLRYGLSGDPDTIDPRFVADETGALVVDALFDSLVALDDDLQPVPAAAESWQVSDDGTTFTFTLREDGRFHDGTPVTAADFARSFDRIADGTAEPRSLLAFQLEPVRGFAAAQSDGASLAGVEAVDERTLRITLDEPFPEFLSVLSRPGLAPVPPAADEDLEAFGTSPVGNGPFEMAEAWQRGQFIRVARADTWWGEVLLDEVVFRIYAGDPGAASQFADLEAGQLQVAEVPAGKRAEAESRFGRADGSTGPGVLDGLTSTIYYYGFNLEQAPFDDVRVRRAVSLAIDRERIAAEVLAGLRAPADAIVPPPIPGSQVSPCAHCRFAPDEAAALAAEVRADGVELASIELVHNDGPTHEAIAAIVAESLREVLDVEVAVRSQGLQEYVAGLRAGVMQVFRLGWQADYPSPGSYLVPLFSGDNVGVDNLTRYDVAEVTQQLEAARAEMDATARVEAYRAAERRILDDVAIAPMLFYRSAQVVAEGVNDLTVSPLGSVDLTRVWLDDAP